MVGESGKGVSCAFEIRRHATKIEHAAGRVKISSSSSARFGLCTGPCSDTGRWCPRRRDHRRQRDVSTRIRLAEGLARAAIRLA